MTSVRDSMAPPWMWPLIRPTFTASHEILTDDTPTPTLHRVHPDRTHDFDRAGGHFDGRHYQGLQPDQPDRRRDESVVIGASRWPRGAGGALPGPLHSGHR